MAPDVPNVRRPSDRDAVRSMYQASADDYAQMMDTEIELPVYADTLERLCERIRDAPGPIVDAACGSGHMLGLISERFDPGRPLVGVDLAPRMVSITAGRLGPHGQAIVGDMTRLTMLPDASCAAVISFFAVHHLPPQGVRSALQEWRRVLVPGGQLVVAAWEGEGTIDYGDHSDLVALRYRSDDLRHWSEEAGFAITRCDVEPVDDFPMDAIHLEGTAC